MEAVRLCAIALLMLTIPVHATAAGPINGPEQPVRHVSAHLHVTNAPDIVLLRGERSVSSTLVYNESGDSTVHRLEVNGPVPVGGTIRLDVDGDYGDNDESATVVAEGQVLDSVGSTGRDCTPDSVVIPISQADFADLTADGVVQVIVRNSPYVDAFCVANQHRVTLAWRVAADSIDFGVQYTGFCHAATLDVANRGTDTLVVSSFLAGDSQFQVTPSSFRVAPLASTQVLVTFCPAETGLVTTTLTAFSNDPDEGTTTLRVRGMGTPPPDIAVGADSLYAELLPNEVVTRLLPIVNTGEGPLFWTAQTLDGIAGAQSLASHGSITALVPERAVVARRSLDVLESDSGPVTLDPQAGSLPGGAATNLSVTFRSAGLLAGTYDTRVVIGSNDPDEAQVNVPTKLRVLPRADIAVTPATLAFAPVFVGSTATESLWVANTGSVSLHVSSVQATPAVFSVPTGGFSVSPGTGRWLRVKFTPVAAMLSQGSVVIHNDDPNHPNWSVPVSADGWTPPEIAVTPESLSAELGPHASVSRTLTLTNSGGSPLVWQIGRDYALVPAQPAASARTAMLAEAQARQGVDSRDDGRADVATLVRARLASLSPQCILFHDDVEHGTNGWTTVAYLQDDLWHPTTRAWNSAGHAWWCGVEAKGTYETGRTIRNGLISPVIDLREVAAPVSLEYADNFAVEPLVDRCRVQINMVGSPIWFDLDNEAGSSGGWRLNVFDLSGFAGHQVRIQFLFETRLLADYYPGWFVDDVLVTSAPPKWVTADSDSGTTARGGSTDVQITFDTEGLIGGEYDAVLRVTSNDADESLVTVPTRLSVPAVPLLSVAPDTVTFDSTSIGSQTARSVMLRNIGTGDLNVNGLDVTPAVFGVPHDGLVLAPNASSSVALTFTPDRGGWSEGVMVVHSDDPENPDRRVPLRGFGLVPPDVEVSPDSLLVSVGYDERTDRTVQIANRGGQPLAWSVLRELTIAPAGAASTAAVRTRGLPATAGRRPGHGLRVPGGSGQVTALVKARLASVPASNIIFADDMEHGSSGWTVSGVDPLWHLTSQASNSGSFSWWCGVDSLYGYGIPRPVLTALVSTPIDLRGAQIPLRLEFAENYQTEWGWDDCAVHVTSDDGTTWQVLRWPTSGNSGGWQLTSLDLSPWAGQVIRFRFQFNTHDTQHNDYPGWFVDDVMVLSMAPTWMAVTPESGSLAGGGTADLQVSFTSAGLPDAAYDATLRFSTNDPDQGSPVVPVRMDLVPPLAVDPPATIDFELAPVRPNIARTEAWMEFALTRPGHARVAVYDVVGRRVHVVAEGDYPAGRQRVAWRGEGAGGQRQPAGLYLVRLEAIEGRRTRRFVWMP